MSAKPTVATGHLQGCFGCHIAIFDLHEGLPDLLAAVDLVRSPINDVKDVPEADIGVLDGCVANEDNRRLAERFRERCKTIVSLGTCACMGGIPGLRNLHPLRESFEAAYLNNPTTPEGRLPESPEIPPLLPTVLPLAQVIHVDAEIPGCPPPPRTIAEGILTLAAGRSFELPRRNLCHECVRQHRRLMEPRREYLTDEVHSLMELPTIDRDLCFLEQGVLCMGPATREGCDSRCVRANSPCRGCMGPTPSALEQGAKTINALATVLPAGGLLIHEDIVGVGYRYSLPVSILARSPSEKED